MIIFIFIFIFILVLILILVLVLVLMLDRLATMLELVSGCGKRRERTGYLPAGGEKAIRIVSLDLSIGE